MRARSERTLLFLVGAVQFVNVLDFMIVMPLGPDFAAALGIPASRLGLVGGAYTAAAAVAGIAGAGFLDRFDRRTALAAAMAGLVVATFAGGLSTSLGAMLAARIAAGAFGGPATSLALSIVADVVPPERRGKALGAVMSAFSISAVVGVPAALELARAGGWRLPFFAVSALGAAIAGAALALMPPLRGHLARSAAPPPAAGLLRRPLVLLSLSGTATAMMAGFAIIPNIAAHLQLNLGYPRARLGLLYMVGGAVTFGTMRLAGHLVDRAGAAAVAAGATALFLAVLGFGFAFPPAGVPVLPLFVAFMVANSTRNVSLNTLSTRVPEPAERARFMSAQSAVQHLAAAFGAALSSRLLWESGGRLEGMPRLAAFAGVLALALPVIVAGVAAGLRTRARDAAPAAEPPGYP
jgi:predicted MFS family arabinose efflux permease